MSHCLLPPSFSKERNRLGLRRQRIKTKPCLFVAMRMLLMPQLEQKRRHLCNRYSGSMNRRVASRTKREHQSQNRLARNPVMHDDRPLIATGRIRDAAVMTSRSKPLRASHRNTHHPVVSVCNRSRTGRRQAPSRFAHGQCTTRCWPALNALLRRRICIRSGG